MNPQLLPASTWDDAAPWERTLLAFLAEKERRSGSHRTVESYARMLWPFFGRVGSPETVTSAHVLAWAHGIGAPGREPSSATVGARIACLSSFSRFLIRMNILTGNPCDALERPRTVPSVARGLSAAEVRWAPTGGDGAGRFALAGCSGSPGDHGQHLLQPVPPLPSDGRSGADRAPHPATQRSKVAAGRGCLDRSREQLPRPQLAGGYECLPSTARGRD